MSGKTAKQNRKMNPNNGKRRSIRNPIYTGEMVDTLRELANKVDPDAQFLGTIIAGGKHDVIRLVTGFSDVETSNFYGIVQPTQVQMLWSFHHLLNCNCETNHHHFVGTFKQFLLETADLAENIKGNTSVVITGPQGHISFAVPPHQGKLRWSLDDLNPTLKITTDPLKVSSSEMLPFKEMMNNVA